MLKFYHNIYIFFTNVLNNNKILKFKQSCTVNQLHDSIMCVFFGVFFTMDSAFWVLCNRGSGSWERCIHSGTLIVPPSRSAMITSSCKQKPKPNQKLPNESWSNVTRIWPPVLRQIEKCLSVRPWAHQLLNLALEHGVHSDDKGRRRAQHL